MVGIIYLPETLLQRLGLYVVERKEGLRFEILLLQILYALSGRFLRVHHDGLHVLAKHFRNRDVVSLVYRLAHIVHAIVLKGRRQSFVTCRSEGGDNYRKGDNAPLRERDV